MARLHRIATSLAREGATVIVKGRTKKRVNDALKQIRSQYSDAKLERLVADVSESSAVHRKSGVPSGRSRSRSSTVTPMPSRRTTICCSARADSWISRSRTEQEGVQCDRQQRAGDDQALGFGGKQTKCNSKLGEDKGELPNLRQAGGNGESRAKRVAEYEND